MNRSIPTGAIWLTLVLLSILNPQLSTVFAQGSLTPPGAPAPLFKTLQVLFPPDPGATTTETIGFPPGSPQRFFRVQALKPLP